MFLGWAIHQLSIFPSETVYFLSSHLLLVFLGFVLHGLPALSWHLSNLLPSSNAHH